MQTLRHIRRLVWGPSGHSHPRDLPAKGSHCTLLAWGDYTHLEQQCWGGVRTGGRSCFLPCLSGWLSPWR